MYLSFLVCKLPGLTIEQTLEFIKNGQNVILAGNPGTGKTHIAIGVGIQACKEGFKVLFTSAPTLINKLKEPLLNKGSFKV